MAAHFLLHLLFACTIVFKVPLVGQHNGIRDANYKKILGHCVDLKYC
jgi:hypothetical protein